MFFVQTDTEQYNKFVYLLWKNPLPSPWVFGMQSAAVPWPRARTAYVSDWRSYDMVCRECGAYNAEHLTHCRVCAAKLKDDDAITAAQEDLNLPDADTEDEEALARPAREFAKAPSWPTRAYAGAPENPPIRKAAPVTVTSTERPASATVRPQAAPAVPQLTTCPNCGKPALPDAPFCPYCAARLDGAAEAPVYASARPASSARPAQKAAPAPAARPAKRSPALADLEDVDEFDDEDDYDEPPQKKRGGLFAKKNKLAEVDDGDDYDDGEFDDDEFEDDYDDDAFDDIKPKKGKGSTLLFWGLIVLLVALIAVFGMYIVKKNFGGDVGALTASISSIFGKDKPADDPAAPPEAQVVMNTATVTEYTDPTTSEVFLEITIHALTGSSVKINTKTALQQNVAPVSADNILKLRVARDAFMPNEPCESETVVITPDIDVTMPDGQTAKVQCESVTVTVPVLSITVSEPLTDTVQQTINNDPITIAGQVSDTTLREIYINEQPVAVLDGGVFTYDYKPTNPVNLTAPAEGAEPTTAEQETITIVASKNNAVTARKVITIEPYVMQNLTLLVNNEVASLGSTDGNVTIVGTVTPGATITPTCSSSNVTFGVPTVSETGTYSLALTISQEGAYTVNLSAKGEGYFDASTSCTVERAPTASSSSFRKAATALNDTAYGKISGGSTLTGNYTCTIKVTEIVSSSPYVIFKGTISGTKLEVYCCNRSASNTINSADVGEKKQIAGTLVGLYPDTQVPYLWTWFIWNK